MPNRQPAPTHEAEIAHEVSAIVASVTQGDAPLQPATVVELARVAVPGAEHAGLTLLRPERPPSTLASSGPVPRSVDRLQYELDDGPCLDAATGPAVTLSPDVAEDRRWTLFGPRCAAETGVRSVLALRLPVGGADHAALNLYAEDLDAFSPRDVIQGSLLAPLAALVLESHLRRRDVADLRAALETSRTIGMAIGILMTTHRVDRVGAFTLLRQASMDLNAKLRDVAAEVADTGTLPDPRPPRRS